MRRRARIPVPCWPPTERHRLAVGLALSLACHLLLAVGGPPPSTRSAPRDMPPLTVVWRPPSLIAAAPNPTPRPAYPALSAPSKHPYPRSITRTTPATTSGNAIAPRIELAIAAPGKPDAASLLEQARQQIASENRRQMLDPMFSPPPATGRPSAAGSLARALAPGALHLEQLTDGMVRVTAANGRQYCLQPTPEIVSRGLPQAPTSLPMNCP